MKWSIDTRGQQCPAPIIEAKKVIREGLPADKVELITDNDTVFGNLKDYLCELDIRFREIYEGDIRILEFVIPESVPQPSENKEYRCADNQSYVVVLKGERMGSGDDALGEILLRAFLNTLAASDLLPSTIILYNSGVKLAEGGKDSAVALQKLENRGVSVLACGTCVDFYDIKQKLVVGMITNMDKIVTITAGASRIVYP